MEITTLKNMKRNTFQNIDFGLLNEIFREVKQHFPDFLANF